jgi:hypothetical protein
MRYSWSIWPGFLLACWLSSAVSLVVPDHTIYFSAVSGNATRGAGAIRISGSHVGELLTSVVLDDAVVITLPAAPISMWRRGKMLRPQDGLTAVGPPISSKGEDAMLGPFEQVSQSWVCEGEQDAVSEKSRVGAGSDGRPCLVTSVRVLQDRPAVVWRQEWPRGLTNGKKPNATSSLGTVNRALCTFPAFVGGKSNTTTITTTSKSALKSTRSTRRPRRLGDLGFVTWASEFAVTPAWRAGRWPDDYGTWKGDWAMCVHVFLSYALGRSSIRCLVEHAITRVLDCSASRMWL